MAWLAVYKPDFRKLSVIGSSASILGAMWAADVASLKLRENDNESTTATMPYVSFQFFDCGLRVCCT
jgi:hypothetical protein